MSRISARAEPVQVKIRVIPNAKKTHVGGFRDDELILRVSAPPVEGKANKVAIEFMARHLGVSRSAVTIVSGKTSRHKVFQIVGLKRSELQKKLTEAGPKS